MDEQLRELFKKAFNEGVMYEATLSRAYNFDSFIEDNIEQLRLYGISGSTLLPDGWKVYKCTDCQEINVKKDNRQITVGFCDNCEHPLWNDDVD